MVIQKATHNCFSSKYYEALGAADRKAEASPFVDFILGIIFEALAEASGTDQVTDQVKALLEVFEKEESLASADLLQRLNLRHKPTLRKNYLDPALAAGFLEMTQPNSPNSPTQRYRITPLGLAIKFKN